VVNLAHDLLADGSVRVERALDPAFCEAVVGRAFERMGMVEADPSSWPPGRTNLPVTTNWDLTEVAPRAAEVLSDLVGAGTVRFSGVQDNLIVNLPDADTPWFGPSEWRRDAAGWHKDGDWFRHFLDSPEQALLVVVFWRDVVERQGATYVAVDSIGPVARLLADHPDGLDPPALGGRVREILAGCRDVRALTGRQGDIVFAHPFLLHSASVNALTVPRVISNSSVMLCDPMCFDRADDRYTAVERSILAALGVDSFDFRATGPRGKVESERARRWRADRAAQVGDTDSSSG
jgi:hypothetical protein